MELSDGGWIRIHRKLMGHWLWNNESYLKAWLSILMTVNYEDSKVLIHGELINCSRGQSVRSLGGWVKVFGTGWTIQRVRTYFKLLSIDEMVTLESVHISTRLTVCNYELYQDYQQANNKQTTTQQQAPNNRLTTNNKKEEERIRKNKNTHTAKCVGVSDFLIDFDKLGEYFNTQLSPPMPKILLPITEKRIAAVEAMVKEYGKEKVIEMFSIASKSKFLLGSGSNGWKARFDWLFKPENFVNVLEGSYLGTEKKDIASKADKAYLERIRKSEEHQKYLDEIARTCTLPPKGLSINRINNK